MNVLLDSDVVIEVLRARDRQLLAQWTELAGSHSRILVSPITIAEVGAGAFDEEKASIARLFSAFTIVVIDEKIGQLSGELLRRFGRSHGLKIADALIAASALHLHAALWTRNRKHYPMPELKIYA